MVYVPGLVYDPAASVVATPSPGADTTAARANDPRFNGIELVDVKSRYGLRGDGASHPLSAIFGSYAEATGSKGYPNAGLTQQNWSAAELDATAVLQAEYDGRPVSSGGGGGSGAILGISDGLTALVDRTLWLQDASRVWLHAGKRARFITGACGTSPGIRVSKGNFGHLIVPLRGINLSTSTSLSSPSGSGRGARYTGYQTGAVAIAFDNTIGARIERTTWSGYDRPMNWGDHVYGITFEEWAAGACNVGWNWDQTGPLDSMERIYVTKGNAANCNTGMDINTTYTNPDGSKANAGGSIWLQNNAFDYNIVAHLNYLGIPDGYYNGDSGLHVENNHFETTDVCSDNSSARIRAQGTAFFDNNEFYENGLAPVAFVLVPIFNASTFTSNRMNCDGMALATTTTTNAYVSVAGIGNRGKNPNVRVVLLKAVDGSYLQSEIADKKAIEIKADPGPLRIEQANSPIYLGYPQAGNLGLPVQAEQDIPINTVIPFQNYGAPVTFIAAAGSQAIYNPVDNSKRTVATGGRCEAWKYAANNWMLTGPGLTS